MNFKYLVFMLTAVLWFFSSDTFASSSKDTDVGFGQANVERLSDGVFLVRDQHGERVYGYGVGGMNHAMKEMEKVLFDDHGAIREDASEALIESYAYLGAAIEESRGVVEVEEYSSSTSSQSIVNDAGRVCGLRFSLSAGVFQSSSWALAGYAQASFHGQPLVGPPAPPNHLITVYSQVQATSNGNTTTASDIRTEHYGYWGEVEVSSYLEANAFSCAQQEVFSYVHYPNCSTNGFRSVSTSGSLNCSN